MVQLQIRRLNLLQEWVKWEGSTSLVQFSNRDLDLTQTKDLDVASARCPVCVYVCTCMWVFQVFPTVQTH